MIELSKLNKIYSTAHGDFSALNDINLHVNAGEIYGVIGKSGAGKSTLLRCVNLLEKPTSGDVRVANQDLTTLSTHELRLERRKIGMIFQHFNLLNARTVYDNIALPLELAQVSRQNIRKAIMPLLELTGLTKKQHAYPSKLSGGQKQRVAIARALVSKPHVLLSDEATSSLDPETTTSILQLLKNIRDQLQLTILLITHEMSVIKECCDRVGILEQGNLIEENEVGAFFTHAKTATAKNFIDSSLPQRLPSGIEQNLLAEAATNTHPVIRLWFRGDAATQSIISNLINQFQLHVNILQANVECIKKHVLGIMIVAISGEKENITNALHYLKSINVQTEVIGHVPNDFISFT